MFGDKKPAPKGKAPVKSGRKSIEDVRKELGFGDVPGQYVAKRNDLELDPALAKELTELELVPRWINFQKYRQRGFHKSRWVPYKRTSSPGNSAVYSVDPQGYTVYQDLVLGVKPEDWNEAHKKMLRRKAQLYSNPQELKAKEFKEFTRANDVGATVKEGYED